MAKNGYVPRRDIEKVRWLNQFSSKLTMYGAHLGLSPAELTSVQNDAAYFSWLVNLVWSMRCAANELTAHKELIKHAVKMQHISGPPSMPVLGSPPVQVAEGIFDRVAKLVQRIKNSPDYASHIGQDLGIISVKSRVETSALKPELKVKPNAGHPQIKCKRLGADALDLYVDRKDDKGFILLMRLTIFNYTDEFPLPSSPVEWLYKAKYVIGNDVVGEESNVVGIVVKG